MDLLEILSNQKNELELLDLSTLIERKEETEINLESSLAQIVIGVRRSGKSTLCQKVLLQSGVSFAYINFDDENLSQLKVEDMNEVMQVLYRIHGDFTHLFVDEIQNLSGWPLLVNRLLRQGVKLIITGSNANLLSGELATYLTGRYNQIVLYPFSFWEYCKVLKLNPASKTTKNQALILRALDNYLINGGFPEILIGNQSRKYTLSLLHAIVSKDICKRYHVRHKQTLLDMANGILDSFCQEVSATELAKKYQLGSVHTAKNYLGYLENAYLLSLIPKYSWKSTEKQQSKKCYAIDLAFISGHDTVLQPENLGWRLENAVCIELLRRYNGEYQQIFYLKKGREFEVDFTVVENSHVKELIQVTYDFRLPKTKLYNREIGGLVKASRDTGCRNLTLIMMEGTPDVIESDGIKVQCVLAKDWFFGYYQQM